MNTEQKEYLDKLYDLVSQERKISSTTLCQRGELVTLVWRIAKEPQNGYSFEVVGRDQQGKEHLFLWQEFWSFYEIFGNLPLDPLAFGQDPNQD